MNDTVLARDSSLKIEKLLMTYDEVAQFFCCCRKTAENWVKAGVLPAPTTFGRLMRFKTKDIVKVAQKKGA